MKSIVLEGLDDVVSSVRAFPASVDTSSAFEEIGQEFSARLRAATPKGFSGRLKDSVMYELAAEGDEVVVGYEEGVQTAGDEKLDSVRRPRTKGSSVLRRWIQAEDLESVLEETLDAYADEAVSVLERSLPDVVS